MPKYDHLSKDELVRLLASRDRRDAMRFGLVLDFFAGSGTTAHAVLKLNAEDGGKRRFILVSNAETTADEPDKNLCRRDPLFVAAGDPPAAYPFQPCATRSHPRKPRPPLWHERVKKCESLDRIDRIQQDFDRLHQTIL